MTAAPAVRFNAEMFSLARARARLTQAKLAEASGIGQSVISKLEHGVRVPSEQELAVLAEILDVPPSFFDRPDHERFVSAPPLFRLQRKRVSQAAIDQLNAEMQTRAMHLRTMQLSVDLVSQLPPPPELSETTPEDAAQFIRNLWLVRPGPIANLTALLEAAGIFVIELETSVREFEGCAFRAPGLPSAIFVRTQQPPDRRRFTLAHELGHLVLHATAADDPEGQANRFAQELLFPAADARAAFGPSPRLERLRVLKRHWRVSLAFLVMRAGSVGALTKAQKSRAYAHIGKLGWRTEEPDPPAPEPPTLFGRVLGILRNDLGYSVEDLAVAFREHPATVEQFYGLVGDRPRGGLRVI